MDVKDISSINTIKNVVTSYRNRRNCTDYSTEFPAGIGIKLTNRCNLRCKHCYQWSETGHHHFMSEEAQKLDFPYDRLLNVLKESRPYRSRLYLWGGEPFVYSHFDELAHYLETDRRDLVFCTNATLIEPYLDHFHKMASALDFLIPIEGFEEQHNRLRGNTYQLVMHNMQELIKRRNMSDIKIKISVHTVVNNENVGDLYHLVEYFEQLNIDLLMICLPWYISSKTCTGMDECYKDKFSWLGHYQEEVPRTWYGFQYRLKEEYYPVLKEQIEKIIVRSWKINLLYLPDFDKVNIDEYLEDSYQNLYQKKMCLGVSIRTDIAPNGSVFACKHFHEFTMGNVFDSSLKEIWNGENYHRFRQQLNNDIMPVCSKCSVLHLNSVL